MFNMILSQQKHKYTSYKDNIDAYFLTRFSCIVLLIVSRVPSCILALNLGIIISLIRLANSFMLFKTIENSRHNRFNTHGKGEVDLI